MNDSTDTTRECREVRPGTMGWQRCWLPTGHDGDHRCQGHPMYSDWPTPEKVSVR